MKKSDLPRKDLRKIIKKIEPDLNELLDLLESDDGEEDENVVGEIIRNGARNLLIAKRIIKESRQ